RGSALAPLVEDVADGRAQVVAQVVRQAFAAALDEAVLDGVEDAVGQVENEGEHGILVRLPRPARVVVRRSRAGVFGLHRGGLDLGPGIGAGVGGSGIGRRVVRLRGG